MERGAGQGVVTGQGADLTLSRPPPDVDECETVVCPGENEKCQNTEGSYRCVCAEGYKQVEGICVKEQIPGERGVFPLQAAAALTASQALEVAETPAPVRQPYPQDGKTSMCPGSLLAFCPQRAHPHTSHWELGAIVGHMCGEMKGSVKTETTSMALSVCHIVPSTFHQSPVSTQRQPNPMGTLVPALL